MSGSLTVIMKAVQYVQCVQVMIENLILIIVTHELLRTFELDVEWFLEFALNYPSFSHLITP